MSEAREDFRKRIGNIAWNANDPGAGLKEEFIGMAEAVYAQALRDVIALFGAYSAGSISATLVEAFAVERGIDLGDT